MICSPHPEHDCLLASPLLLVTGSCPASTAAEELLLPVSGAIAVSGKQSPCPCRAEAGGPLRCVQLAAGTQHPIPGHGLGGSAGAGGSRGAPELEAHFAQQSQEVGGVTFLCGTISGLHFSHLRLLNLFHNEKIKSCSRPKSA